jgi:hypothetical protein
VRRKAILVIALAATLVIGVSAALAARSYSTKIVFLGNSGPTSDPNDQTFYGDLNAHGRCVTARTVGLFKKTSTGDYKLLDVDFSSYNGAWALRAELTGSPDLAVRVKREKRHHGRIVCKAATLTLTPNPQSAEYSGAR